MESPRQHRGRGRVSAGLLLYRSRASGLEVFIAHPGGPWFPHAEFDSWTIPKGEVEPGESLLQAAIREFIEEVGILPAGPYLPLGSIRQRGGKTVHAWAFQGEIPEGKAIASSVIDIEWPPNSGKWSRWPEIDRAGFFPVAEAKRRLKEAQHPFLERLQRSLFLGPEIDHEHVREDGT